jgi:opacity protein-like surface antigen
LKRATRLASLLLAPAAALFLPVAATAQPAASPEPARHGTDLFAGYSFVHFSESTRHGGDLAAGFHLFGPLSGFVDASFHWGDQDGTSLSDLTLMAGPGLRFGARGRTVLFVRALAGLVRDRATISVLDVDISETSSSFGVLAGAGVDFRVSAKLAVRLQGDYLGFDSGGGAASCVPGVPSCDDTGGGSWSSGYRVSAGVVYRFASAR